MERFILQLNAQILPEGTDFNFNEEIEIIEAIPFHFDSNQLLAEFSPDLNLQVDDFVKWNDGSILHFYQIKEVNDTGVVLDFLDPNLIDDFYFSTMQDFDLGNAKIEFSDELTPVGLTWNEDHDQKLMRLSSGTNSNSEFKFHDFTIRFSYTQNSFHVYAFKKTSLDANYFAQLDLKNIKPSFSWKGSLTNIEFAQLKLNYDAIIQTGLKKGSYQLLYVDSAKLDPARALETIADAWTSKRADIDTVIPIAKISLPIAGIPACTLDLQLQMRLYISGKIEFLFSMNNEHGIEIRNNKLRILNSSQKDIDFIIQASGGISAKIQTSVNMLALNLMDIGAEAGIKAEVKSTLHFPQKQSIENISSVPFDVLDSFTLDNKDWTVCGDMQAFWLLNLIFNSDKSVAGKLGLGKTIELMNERNASLFGKPIRHIENMQFVDQCTHKNRYLTPLPTIYTNTDRIVIQKYSFSLMPKETEQLKIRGLPSGVVLDDLIFSSSNPAVAMVDNRGNVVAISAGNAIITVSSKDQEYQVSCSILVKRS